MRDFQRDINRRRWDKGKVKRGRDAQFERGEWLWLWMQNEINKNGCDWRVK